MVRKVAITALFASIAVASTSKDLPEFFDDEDDFGSDDLVNMDDDFDEYEESNGCTACDKNTDCVNASCGGGKNLCCDNGTN